MALPIIASFQDLEKVQKKCAADFALRELSDRPQGISAEEIKELTKEGYEQYVLCCGGTGCHASQSAEIIKRFEDAINENGLEKKIKVIRTGCFGFCEQGPIVQWNSPATA